MFLKENNKDILKNIQLYPSHRKRYYKCVKRHAYKPNPILGLDKKRMRKC